MKPYYADDAVTLYHGDAREIVPALGHVDAIVTDPVWPNATVELAGHENPGGLLRAVLDAADADRAIVPLGCDTDPRFLDAVPLRWPFLRVCWLRYSRPNYKGRLLNGADVAYVFGQAPTPRPGATVMPGESNAFEVCNTNSDPRTPWHPCPRRLAHVAFLVQRFGGGIVLDPFSGSGTTLVAAKSAGVRAIGVEIEERYCEGIARRVEMTTASMFALVDGAAKAAEERA